MQKKTKLSQKMHTLGCRQEMFYYLVMPYVRPCSLAYFASLLYVFCGTFLIILRKYLFFGNNLTFNSEIKSGANVHTPTNHIYIYIYIVSSVYVDQGVHRSQLKIYTFERKDCICQYAAPTRPFFFLQ